MEAIKVVFGFIWMAGAVLLSAWILSLSGCGTVVANEDPANEKPPYSGHKAVIYSPWEKWFLDPLHYDSAIWLEHYGYTRSRRFKAPH